MKGSQAALGNTGYRVFPGHRIPALSTASVEVPVRRWSLMPEEKDVPQPSVLLPLPSPTFLDLWVLFERSNVGLGGGAQTLQTESLLPEGVSITGGAAQHK